MTASPITPTSRLDAGESSRWADAPYFAETADLFIPTILGTARHGRKSTRVAGAVIDLIKARSMMTDVIDVADYRLTATGDEADGLDRYRELMVAADGLVIVAPEYNHSYPGELKLLLDSEFSAYERKPVGFVSVSSGLVGGTRLVEQLRLLTTALRMVPVSPAVHVVDVDQALDEDGRLASSSLEQVANDMLDEVAWFAQALVLARAGRP